MAVFGSSGKVAAADGMLPSGGGGVRSGGGGRRQKGITMEDLKRQTAQRLAQQQPAQQQQPHPKRTSSFSPRQSPTSSASPGSPQSQGSGNRWRKPSHRSLHPAKDAARSVPSTHNQHRSTSQYRNNTNKPHGNNQAKLPHGLTVHELKAMTRARLQAEAAEAEEVMSRASASPFEEVRERAAGHYSPDPTGYSYQQPPLSHSRYSNSSNESAGSHNHNQASGSVPNILQGAATIPTLVQVQQQPSSSAFMPHQVTTPIKQQQQNPQIMQSSPYYDPNNSMAAGTIPQPPSRAHVSMSPLPGGYGNIHNNQNAPPYDARSSSPGYGGGLPGSSSSSFAHVVPSKRSGVGNGNPINDWSNESTASTLNAHQFHPSANAHQQQWVSGNAGNISPAQDLGDGQGNNIFSASGGGSRQRSFTADARFHGIIREDHPYLQQHEQDPSHSQQHEWGTSSSFSKPSGLPSSRYGAIGSAGGSADVWSNNRPRASSTTSLPSMVNSATSDFSDYPLSSGTISISASGSSAWASSNNIESPSLGSLSSCSIFRAPPGFSGSRAAARSADLDTNWSSGRGGADIGAPSRLASRSTGGIPGGTEGLYADLILGNGNHRGTLHLGDETSGDRLSAHDHTNDSDVLDLGLGLSLLRLASDSGPDPASRERLNTYPLASSPDAGWSSNNINVTGNSFGDDGWGER